MLGMAPNMNEFEYHTLIAYACKTIYQETDIKLQISVEKTLKGLTVHSYYFLQ